MLDQLFLQILNMSFNASFVILFVLLIRFLLKKTPKVFSYALWSVVLFRLICPFSFESIISPLPINVNPLSKELLYAPTPQIDTGLSSINQTVNTFLPPASPTSSINPLQVWIFVGQILWLLGLTILLIYSILSFVKLKKQLKDATCQSANIYISSTLHTPFVLGVFQPKIYLPASLSTEENSYILLHEQTHIKRLDHIVKIVSFIVLCIHWFNPLAWVAFFISGRDMEMACDETVLRKLGTQVKKTYSTSLLSLATGKRIVNGIPLAFGEGNTKSRIKNVLSYKKPSFWALLLMLLVTITIGICLLANPADSKKKTAVLPSTQALWDARTESIEHLASSDNPLTLLPFTETTQNGIVQIYTEDKQKGIGLELAYEETDTFPLEEINQSALVFFAFIQDADNFYVSTQEAFSGGFEIHYNRSWANDFVGGNISDYGKSPEALQELLNLSLEDATPPIYEKGDKALILEIDETNQTMVVSALDKTSPLSDQCEVSCKDATLVTATTNPKEMTDISFSDFSVGNNVRINYDSVAESYPTQATATRIELLK